MGQSILENIDAPCLETILIMRCSETNSSLEVVVDYSSGRYGYSFNNSQYFFVGRIYGNRHCSMDSIENLIEGALESEWGVYKKDCPEFDSIFEDHHGDGYY